MQNMERGPLFCTQFAKQKVCPILYFYVFKRLFGWNINQINLFPIKLQKFDLVQI